MSSQQAQILRDIIGASHGGKLIRPQTAATTTKKDEDRIKKQLRYLEQLEAKIDLDLEKMNHDDINTTEKKKGKKIGKGKHITR